MDTLVCGALVLIQTEKTDDLWTSKSVVISSSVTDSSRLTCTFDMIRHVRVQYILVAYLSGSSCKH